VLFRSSDDNTLSEVAVSSSTPTAKTLTSTFSTLDSFSVSSSAHGEAIIFYINMTGTNTSNTTSYSYYVRIREGSSNYFPDSDGLRIMRAFQRGYTDTKSSHNHGGSTGTDGEHNHTGMTGYMSGHDHSGEVPSGGGHFHTSLSINNNGDHYHSISSGGSHDHRVDNSFASGNVVIYVPINPAGKTFYVEARVNSGTFAVGSWLNYYIVSRHNHGNGTYKTNSHKHDVSIGTGGSGEAGSINASNVVARLEYWNESTSSWVTKVTYTPSPSKILEFQRDMSDGGSFPDAVGFWRIRLNTNSASSDLLKCVVSINHFLDN
jgi:hypothetical protein